MEASYIIVKVMFISYNISSEMKHLKNLQQKHVQDDQICNPEMNICVYL